MAIDPDLYFELTMDELREVTHFALASAEDATSLVTPPADPRMVAAIQAARRFVAGEPRSKLQRVAALDAHRASKDALDPVAYHATLAAGDAAASAYLHPYAKSDQVAHILRSSVHAALAAEAASLDPSAARNTLSRARVRATPTLVAVLRRYPAYPKGRSRVSQLLSDLDLALRQQ